MVVPNRGRFILEDEEGYALMTVTWDESESTHSQATSEVFNECP